MTLPPGIPGQAESRTEASRSGLALSGHYVILFLLGIVFISFLAFRPVGDLDFFWQLKAGQMMLSKGSLLNLEPFSYLHLGRPLINPGWLAQIIFALLYSIGGWSALRWFHNIISILPFLIAASIPIPRKSAAGDFNSQPQPLAAALAASLGFVASLSNNNLRPQDFALLSFASLLYILQSKQLNLGKTFSCVIIAVFWQNCHPSLSLGIAACTLIALGRLLEKKSFWRSNVLWTILILIMLGLLQFASPEGSAASGTTADNVSISRNLLGVSEWMPPWDNSVRGAMTAYWLVLGISLLLLTRMRFAIGWTNTLLAVFFTALSLYAARFALFWSVIMLPVWSLSIEKSFPALSAGLLNSVSSKMSGSFAFKIGLSGILMFFVSILSAPGSEELLHQEVPRKAIEYLRSRLPLGRIYNYREWGAALIFYGHPQWTVAIDGRLYLYSASEWQNHYAEALGQVELPDLLSRYKPDAFFLHYGFDQGLIKKLESSKSWRQAYVEGSCVIYLPTAAS